MTMTETCICRSRYLINWLINPMKKSNHNTKIFQQRTFCNLGDMLCSGGGHIAARCCMAWGKFRKLLPVLTTRHLSPRIPGKVYEACVCSAMLHGSEDMGAVLRKWLCHDPLDLRHQRQRRNTQLHYNWNLASRTSHQSFCYRSLRFNGHVQQATYCIKSITNFPLSSTRKKGRPHKTWSECR